MPVSARRQCVELSDEMATRVNVLFLWGCAGSVCEGDCGLKTPHKGHVGDLIQNTLRLFAEKIEK